MKILATIFLLATISSIGYSQQITQNIVPDYLKKIDTPKVYHNAIRLPPVPKFTKEHLNNDTSGFAKAPLMLLKLNPSGNFVKSFPSLGFLKQEDIASMEILKDSVANSLYSAAGKYGVIIIALIPSAKTYTMPQYLEYYGISKKDSKLPLYMDYNLLCNTDGMLITKGDTKTVTIEKDVTGNSYINILTNQYPNLRVHLRNDAEEHKKWSDGLK